ncbi:hypothetical protein B0H14DRAFT_2665528 [Mycena olivaceomarginata]|nr:hypothetical protein B0H14DRAFT_2665528 [Mycena olivaceomarginata]
MEAGEIPGSRSASPPADYDPAYEWPGEADGGPATCGPSLRLLVLRTSVFPTKQTLVITDGYAELQFGRDPAPSPDTPRVRLKEMEVSKLHATAYADGDSWNIVDMGSKHGTFLQPRSSAMAIASVPRPLHHLDTLAIGSTTFLTPCSDCCSTFENEIPIFSHHTNGKLPRSPSPMLDISLPGLFGVRVQITQIALPDGAPSTQLRGLMRQAVGPPLRAEAVASTSQLPPPSAPWDPPPAVTTSQPPTPLPTTNIGHRLLLAQGWIPGASLGVTPDTSLGASEDSDESRIRLTAPLEVTSTSQRAGIGMTKAPSSGDGWREDGRQRRWGEFT